MSDAASDADRGPWIVTSSGGRFYPLDPRPSEVRIGDIAASLSKLCRWTGHCKYFSVAQHSVLVSYAVAAEYAIDGLLHDAAEAYIGDISSPLKPLIRVATPSSLWGGAAVGIAAVEDAVLAAVYESLSLPRPSSEAAVAVKVADRRLLATERRDLMPSVFDVDAEPLPQRILPMLSGSAEQQFLQRFEDLMAAKR